MPTPRGDGDADRQLGRHLDHDPRFGKVKFANAALGASLARLHARVGTGDDGGAGIGVGAVATVTFGCLVLKGGALGARLRSRCAGMFVLISGTAGELLVHGRAALALLALRWDPCQSAKNPTQNTRHFGNRYRKIARNHAFLQPSLGPKTNGVSGAITPTMGGAKAPTIDTMCYLLRAPKKFSILLPQVERAIKAALMWMTSNGSLDAGARATVSGRGQGRLRPIRAENGGTACGQFKCSGAGSDDLSMVIVDEAQDTGDNAWRCIELLASHTQVVCLGDLEQQIFDFLPRVGPERIRSIRHALQPLEADLGNEHHRSTGTQIVICVRTARGPLAPWRN